MNVLVTSVSRKVPLVRAVTAAVGADGGGVVWGGDVDPGCVARYAVDRFWTMPPLEDPGAAEAVRAFCAAEGIDVLLPTRDGELMFFAGLRDALAAAGTSVPVGTPGAVATCLDKLAFHRHGVRHGLPVAATAEDADGLAAERFVVKERHGAAAHGVAVGLDRGAARDHAARLVAPLFQEVLEGVEHSIDAYVDRAGRVVEAAPRARLRVEGGESVVTETVEHPALVDLAVRTLGSLDLRGHVVLQAFARDDGGVALVEVNPRVGGASTAGFHAGVDTPRWLLEEARGQTVEARVGTYVRGLRLVRHPADLVRAP